MPKFRLVIPISCELVASTAIAALDQGRLIADFIASNLEHDNHGELTIFDCRGGLKKFDVGDPDLESIEQLSK